MEATPVATVVPETRKLAYIVRVTGLKPLEWADKIAVAQVEGWEVVVQKGQFEVGDMAVYFEIDSVLPNEGHTAFLEGKRLKTKMFRDQISQGLLGPLSWLGGSIDSFKEGDDVTVDMKVQKWVHPNEMSSYEYDGGDVKVGWISELIPKTDEVRVQSAPKQLAFLKDRKVVVTQKYDGTSATFVVIGGKFSVCGRNRVHTSKDNSNAHFYEIVSRYNLEEKMLALNRNIALQGEIIGPKINGNRHSVKTVEFHAFNLFDINDGVYSDWDDVVQVTTALGLKTVPVVYRGVMQDSLLSVPALLALADQQQYTNGEIPRICEGVVVKSDYAYADKQPRASFKVISNKYLKKYDL